MSNKHSKTFEAIFSQPVKKNIKWSDVEKLIKAVGGVIKQGDGSRIRVDLLN